MTFEQAKLFFDAMDMDQKNRVVRIFDLTRAEFQNVRDAFAHAVADEAYRSIARELLRQLEMVGTA